MKQIKLPDHLIACSGSMLETVAGRIAKIRGIRADDGDAMEKTEDGPEVEDGGEVRIIQIRGVLMRDCRKVHPQALYMGVGGTYDVFTGHVKRAPKVWQNLGLEWLYRLLSQPSRIGRQLKLLKFVGYYYSGKM